MPAAQHHNPPFGSPPPFGGPRRWRRLVDHLRRPLQRTAAKGASLDLSDEAYEWETFEALEQWFIQTDRSLAAYMTRQWRFRHGFAVFAAIFAVAPICVGVGAITHSVPTIIAGCAMFPLTPIAASLIVKVNSLRALRQVLHHRKKHQDV